MGGTRPGNNESAGKLYSGKTGKGNTWLRTTLVQIAHAAVRVKDSYLGALYRNLVDGMGPKKAIIAVAHHIIRAVYHILFRGPDRGTIVGLTTCPNIERPISPIASATD